MNLFRLNTSPCVVAMSLEKLSLCVLMTQSGKTFVAVEKIKERLAADPTSVHVVYTMNTLLNNFQFAKRLESIETDHGVGSVLVVASKYMGPYRHVATDKALQESVRTQMPRVLILCSHHKRFRQGHEWVEQIVSLQPELQIHLYYDELHQYMKRSLRLQLEHIHSLPHVVSMMALTATPRKMFHKRGKWSLLHMVTSEQTTAMDQYARLENMTHVAMDAYFDLPYVKPVFNDFEKMDEETIGFLEHVLDAHPEILAAGNRVFLPAHVRRSGHVTVRDVVLERCPEAVVVVLNAQEKSIVFEIKGMLHKMSLLSNVEVSERIAQIMTMFNLLDRTLVITGFLCVGMGQTITHRAFGNITHTVLSHMNLGNDAIYQLVGRVTGRHMNWPTYRSTRLYCPTVIHNRVKVMEECAAAVFKKLNVTKEVYQLPVYEMPEGVDVQENDSKMKHKEEDFLEEIE